MVSTRRKVSDASGRPATWSTYRAATIGTILREPEARPAQSR